LAKEHLLPLGESWPPTEGSQPTCAASHRASSAFVLCVPWQHDKILLLLYLCLQLINFWKRPSTPRKGHTNHEQTKI
jgi:hypothetical protein